MGHESKGPQGEQPIEQHDELKQSASRGELSPREHFERTSNVGLLMAYDLIDKLRYWEKETLQLSEDQIAERLDHLVNSVERLRDAYLAFAELEP